jgi:cytoskeletal protein RodZ
MTTKKHRSSFTKYFFIFLIIAVIAAGIFILIRHHNQPRVTGSTLNTIHKLTPQPVPNNGNKQPSTPSSQVEQGTSTDNNGASTPVTTNPGQWSISQSGDITVKEPVQNALLQPGATLEGSASVNQVQYTLLDNQVGVISQGTINVVNGTFSATISFSKYSSSGRLDVYSSDANGKEINIVEIPVDF